MKLKCDDQNTAYQLQNLKNFNLAIPATTPPIKAQHTSRDDVREIEYSLGESRQESEMNEAKATTTVCSVCFYTYMYVHSSTMYVFISSSDSEK